MDGVVACQKEESRSSSGQLASGARESFCVNGGAWTNYPPPTPLARNPPEERMRRRSIHLPSGIRAHQFVARM